MAVDERAIARIKRAADRRAHEIAQFIVDEIATNPQTPQDDSPDREPGEHLRYSYQVRQDPETGDWLITTDRHYWAFVEFGTREHGSAQPHVRPAIETARQVFG